MISLPRAKNLEAISRRPSEAQASRWIERRTRSRFHLVFPVVCHWQEETAHSAVGYCRNIGLGGAFIVASICPPIDTEVEIEVVVPVSDPAPGEVLFRHTGRTVRIQRCEDLLGFAVAGEFEHDNAVERRVTAGTLSQP
jgi:hypothetical protein